MTGDGTAAAAEGLALRLTARQRESLEDHPPYFRVACGRLAALGRDHGVQTLTLAVGEAEAFRADLGDVLAFARYPHPVRLRAIRRRVEAFLDRVRAARAALVPPPPPPRPTAIAGRVFRFRVELLGARPRVWRRLDAEDCDLWAFHRILMAAVGWRDDIGPHTFDAGGVTYGPMEMDLDGAARTWADERAAFLHQAFPAAGAAAAYEYDLGRGWRHAVVLERIVRWRFGAAYPVLRGGGGACPPEGGGPRPAGRRRFDVAAAAARVAGVGDGLEVFRLDRPLLAGRPGRPLTEELAWRLRACAAELRELREATEAEDAGPSTLDLPAKSGGT